MEHLTVGKGENLPAARYYTRNLGDPGWSGAFQMDFQTVKALVANLHHGLPRIPP